MRTVTFGMNISLDGYCDHTIFNPSEEVHDYFTQMLNDVDLIVYGRIMYELMFPFWADVAKKQSGTDDENRFAQKLTAIDKVVISRSLDNVEDGTRLVRSNPVDELLKLKQQPGKKISIDSVSLLPELIAADLIDEFHLVVHPVFVGKGRQLLDGGSLQEQLTLKLVDTLVFKSGCVALHYLKQ
ncbi:dihydrofolate reductase family protein [Spirosoma sp. BT702]|uniref:Dihydrofolate reductase family protein n=1 Tax=Spirosoma profusum TaxID=2771354 RepID=A0A926XVK0_9BACT|nr:dihydrofolate reductase family protein [Spirosoma profusum]MBD2701464.1 dihydrofolate reductase family protein [Spirosoma profusum]